MGLIDATKRQLHRDIVADPVLHARVLNLYLNGEAYPHRVDDYFPVAHVEAPELAERMRTHMAEEDKHIALYAKAIDKLGQQVEDLPHACIFNAVIRHHTPESWAVRSHQDRDTRRLRLAHFLAHAHCLEKRVARSLEMHLDACAHAASPYPAKAVAAVLADEHDHVRYTAEAVNELLPRSAAAAVWSVHVAAEKRANLDFSSAQLRRLLRENRSSWPGARRRYYALCAWAMRGLLTHA
jgi:hydroxymethylpyrimidine/phosphomethylpyrimidine kinase